MPAGRTAGVLVCIALAGGVAGCRGGSKSPSVNTGLSSLMGPGATPARGAPTPPKTVVPPAPVNAEMAELIRQQAVDTQRILETLDRERPTTAVASGRPAEPAAAEVTTPVSSQPGVQSRNDSGPASASPQDAGAPSATNTGLAALLGDTAGGTGAAGPDDPAALSEPFPTTPPPPVTLAERINDAANALLGLLREQAAQQDGTMQAEAALAALEAVRPGDHAGSPPAADLAPGQAEAVRSLREIAAAVYAASEREWTGPEAGALGDRLSETAERYAATQPLRVREARLCTRVRGFGQYTPFADRGPDRFIAGRSQRAIAYVEVDRFTHREIGSGDEVLSAAHEAEGTSGGGDRWAVELTQEINLYSDAGNLLVLRHAPERILETARTKRRDFYLVREITLPPNLGAGRYNLKVTVRDVSNGSVAEAVIPIELVADSRGLPR